MFWCVLDHYTTLYIHKTFIGFDIDFIMFIILTSGNQIYKSISMKFHYNLKANLSRFFNK